MEDALAIASSRYPVPSIKVVPQPQNYSSSLSFLERFIYARLQPSHVDTREVQLYSIAAACEVLRGKHYQGNDDQVIKFLDL